MKTYEVTAWCSFPHYTTFEVKARSLKAALLKAQTQVYDEIAEPCNGGSYDWDEFEVHAPNRKSMQYLKPERAVEIAAPELLDVLKRGLQAGRSVTDSWEHGDLSQAVRNLSLWLADAEAAIAKVAQ
jgi:hypothetical protein